MRTDLAVSTFALLSTPAFAQPFLEISWTGATPADTRAGRVVFDAGAAPTSSAGGVVTFEAVATETWQSASAISPDATGWFTPATQAVLTYDSSLDRVEIIAGSVVSSLLLRLTDPLGGFSATMTSLPDNTINWRVIGANAVVTDGFVTWTEGGGFQNGLIHYAVGPVSDPNPPDPCPADCDGNDVLNLDDLDCFVDSFLGGCD